MHGLAVPGRPGPSLLPVPVQLDGVRAADRDRQAGGRRPGDEPRGAARRERVVAGAVDARPDVGGDAGAGERVQRAEVDLGLDPGAAVGRREVGVGRARAGEQPGVAGRRSGAGAPAANVDDTVGGVGVVALGEERAAGGGRVGAADEPDPDADVRRRDRHRDRSGRVPELVGAARACLRQLHRAENGAGHLVDEGREDVVEAEIGDGDGQHPLLDLDLLQLDAGVRVDRRIGKRRARSDELEERAEQEGNAHLARLDVEHQVRRVARRRGLRVAVRIGGARRVRVALIRERHGALLGPAELLVVARPGRAAEAGRLVRDRHVRARRVGEAVAQERAAGEGRRVDLQLQVPLVHPPVADVDRERDEEQEDRRQHRDEHEDAALLARREVRDAADAHAHVPAPAKSAGCSSRIVALPRRVIVLPISGML